MFEKLDHIEAKYQRPLASPEIVSDSAKYQKTAKAHSEVAPVVEKYREFKDLISGIAESKEMLASETDAEMKAYAEQELAELEERVAKVEEELKVLLIPKRSERRQERHPRNPRRHGRRRSVALRRGTVSHVHPVRRNAALESRSNFRRRNPVLAA